MNKSYDGSITWNQRNKGVTARTGTALEDIPVFATAEITTEEQQEVNLYNHYYRDQCYMPLHIYKGLSGKRIHFLREEWANTVIIVRGNSILYLRIL